MKSLIDTINIEYETSVNGVSMKIAAKVAGPPIKGGILSLEDLEMAARKALREIIRIRGKAPWQNHDIKDETLHRSLVPASYNAR